MTDHSDLIERLRKVDAFFANEYRWEHAAVIDEAIAALSSVPGASYFTWKHKNEGDEHRGFGKHHPGFKDDSGYVVDPLFLATPPAVQPIGGGTCLDGRAFRIPDDGVLILEPTTNIVAEVIQGALTGTHGMDGQLNVSVSPTGTLHIENRTGIARTFAAVPVPRGKSDG